MTRLLHRCSERGIAPADLLEQFKILKKVQEVVKFEPGHLPLQNEQWKTDCAKAAAMVAIRMVAAKYESIATSLELLVDPVAVRSMRRFDKNELVICSASAVYTAPELQLRVSHR